MFALKNFILALTRILDIGINVLIFIIFIRAILSWFNPIPNNLITRILYEITEPILHPIRRLMMRFLPRLMIDLSPMVAILLLIFIESFLVKSLEQLAYTL